MLFIPLPRFKLNGHYGSRDVEKDIIPTCRELGIGIVAYSPLGRGFLSAGAKIAEGLTSSDYRVVALPRFAGENLDKNEKLFIELHKLASSKGCSPGQLALAWVQHRGADVVPIPGTTKVKNFKENVGALQVKLSREEVEELEALFHEDAVAGDRYPNMQSGTFFDSETPPLSSWQA